MCAPCSTASVRRGEVTSATRRLGTVCRPTLAGVAAARRVASTISVITCGVMNVNDCGISSIVAKPMAARIRAADGRSHAATTCRLRTARCPTTTQGDRHRRGSSAGTFLTSRSRRADAKPNSSRAAEHARSVASCRRWCGQADEALAAGLALAVDVGRHDRQERPAQARQAAADRHRRVRSRGMLTPRLDAAYGASPELRRRRPKRVRHRTHADNGTRASTSSVANDRSRVEPRTTAAMSLIRNQ